MLGGGGWQPGYPAPACTLGWSSQEHPQIPHETNVTLTLGHPKAWPGSTGAKGTPKGHERHHNTVWDRDPGDASLGVCTHRGAKHSRVAYAALPWGCTLAALPWGSSPRAAGAHLAASRQLTHPPPPPCPDLLGICVICDSLRLRNENSRWPPLLSPHLSPAPWGCDRCAAPGLTK